MTDREVMQQALDAFCKIAHVMGRYDLPGYHNYLVVIANQQADALREAIAQPEQTAFNIKEFTDRVFRMVDGVKFKLEQNKLDAAISARLDVEHFLLKHIAQPTIEEPLKVHVNAEQYMLHKYGAFRGHFAWREIQSAYAQGQLDAAIAQSKDKPAITDEQGRPMTYWGGKATQPAIAQPEQTAVFYQFQTKDGEWHGFSDEAHRKNTVEAGRWLIRALYTAPQVAQPEQQPERNFCARCGKRLTGDGIHTCTPPKDKP